MEDWAKERMNEKHFGRVIAYDSSKLEQWIRENPAVGLWLAKEMGISMAGAMDIETYWLNVQGTMKEPSLAPEVLLVNREGTARAFKGWIDGATGELPIRASSPMEVTAVFAAWIHTLPDNEKNAICARTIVVEDRETWKALVKSPHHLILVPSPRLEMEEELFSEAQRHRHSVLKHIGTRTGNRPGICELERMRRFDLEHALRKSGVDEATATRVAQGAGGNFTILRRVYARDSNQEPKWSRESTLASLLLGRVNINIFPGGVEKVKRERWS